MKRVAIISDPLSAIAVAYDSSLYLAEVALTMHCEVYWVDSTTVITQAGDGVEGRVMAHAMQLQACRHSCYTVLPSHLSINDVMDQSDVGVLDLSTMDLILMRKDPPVDMHYLQITYALSRLVDRGVVVANPPQALRDINEKQAILQFQDVIAATVIASDEVSLLGFLQQHQAVVLKPLDAMGGEGIVRVDTRSQSEQTCLVIIRDALSQHKTVMAQRQLDIHQAGDKRLLVIDGQLFPYAYARYPATDGWLANLAAGGHGDVVTCTDRDHAIVSSLQPWIKHHRLSLVGLDVIAGCLTEINVTCPTLLRQINAVATVDISAWFSASQSSLAT